ncbi:MAG: GNAT family N-acetyltransferase [Tissierellia bacterium]|nr:GNAT family N-acetyltransferase [Tissierellia bacterium]
MLNKKSELLFTRRTQLRRFIPKDLDESYEWMNDEKIKKFANEFYAQSKEQANKKIKDYIESEDKNLDYNWLIILKKNDQAIGEAKANNINEDEKSIDLSLAINSKFKNRGYATEVISKLLEFFFTEVGAEKVRTYSDIDNESWQEVLKKLNFRQISKKGSTIYYEITNISYMTLFSVFGEI